ncbi:MAG TPA: TetR/AcrR family transcriptional regulator [Stackebrandtia sp.]|jgi:AcrR family transcriptional regulator|uniref:TetR/AcrR family transcriptional regulator n=1 Tax=Stackebrandtia sp. TaxID=2023065 RepID=UPI002D472722|nr:TetR/AcrR family transcriptional regulator [Stackebrandtia sp.]HZE39155.1 TetR/AcrR family transcriptional regulator [Stackebrandtia sp.]
MPPRRPERRNEESAAAIIRAAWELCREVGYSKLSIEGIAARAGVGKNTIYRWWSSKAAVLLDGFVASIADVSFPDTGDFATDIKTEMVSVSGILGSPGVGPLYGALIGAAQDDPELAAALRIRLIEPLTAGAVARIERAQQQGQLRSDLDPILIVELLYGPTYYRWLLLRHLPDTERLHAIVDAALSGLAPSRQSV